MKYFSEKNMLIIKNNVKIKESTYSTKTGLRALIRQYQLISDMELRVIKME